MNIKTSLILVLAVVSAAPMAVSAGGKKNRDREGHAGKNGSSTLRREAARPLGFGHYLGIGGHYAREL